MMRMRNVLSCVIIGSLLIGCGQTISDEEDISETIESTTEAQDILTIWKLVQMILIEKIF